MSSETPITEQGRPAPGAEQPLKDQEENAISPILKKGAKEMHVCRIALAMPLRRGGIKKTELDSELPLGSNSSACKKTTMQRQPRTLAKVKTSMMADKAGICPAD